MTEWIWFNGNVMPLAEARISVEDRGFQFADGVYEVFRIYHGRLFAAERHLQRLEQSAKGIRLAIPLGQKPLRQEIENLIARAQVTEGMLYLQLTRGTAPRNHKFPDARPTLLFYARELPEVSLPGEGEGVRLMTAADERWDRCWIKSIALLPNVLAKNAALAAGYDEAVFINDEIVTECSASNVFGVIGGKLVTHPVGFKVLPGVSRAILIECAGEMGIEVDERPWRESEAVRAEEMFISSTTREVNWVARWNERYIGQGRCGAVTRRLHEAIQERVRRETR